MIVYHGSWLEVKNPDLKHSRSDVDFGKGFYVTPLRDQAVKWCGKFKRRGKQGIVTTFEFEENAQENLKILKFDSYSEEWLDFIMNCRRERMIQIMILLWAEWPMIKCSIRLNCILIS